MSKLAIIGTIEIPPGQRDQLLSSVMAHTARCLEDEPGTLEMDVLLPREKDDARFLLYELYRDDEAFEAHLKGASIAQFRKETGGVKVHVTKCALVEKSA